MNTKLLEAISAFLEDDASRIKSILELGAGLDPQQDRWHCGYLAALRTVGNVIAEEVKNQNSFKEEK